MSKLICQAIECKRVVTFWYGGGAREAEPFCHGVTTAGNEAVRAYQTAGYSQSGRRIGWKLFLVGEMQRLSLTDKSFSGSRPGYDPYDADMSVIHCRL